MTQPRRDRASKSKARPITELDDLGRFELDSLWALAESLCPELFCSQPRKRGLSKATLALIHYARTRLEALHPMTLRQLHYAIFSRKEIDYANDKASYARLGRAVSTARRAHRGV
jgi:hypothetical protein